MNVNKMDLKDMLGTAMIGITAGTMSSVAANRIEKKLDKYDAEQEARKAKAMNKSLAQTRSGRK